MLSPLEEGALISTNIRGLAAVERQVKKWMDQVEQDAQETARGLSVDLLNRMIENSPQWTGDFASNWRYSINSVDYTYDEGDVPPKPGAIVEPWKQFDQPAVQLGKAKNRGKDLKFKLGDDVYISNSSTHDEPYAQGVFDGSVKLRDVNRRVVLASVLEDFNATYGKVLNANQVKRLKGRRI